MRNAVEPVAAGVYFAPEAQAAQIRARLSSWESGRTIGTDGSLASARTVLVW